MSYTINIRRLPSAFVLGRYTLSRGGGGHSLCWSIRGCSAPEKDYFERDVTLWKGLHFGHSTKNNLKGLYFKHFTLWKGLHFRLFTQKSLKGLHFRHFTLWKVTFSYILLWLLEEFERSCWASPNDPGRSAHTPRPPREHIINLGSSRMLVPCSRSSNCLLTVKTALIHNAHMYVVCESATENLTRTVG